MARAVLSIVGILATVAVLLWCFGFTMPQITSVLPGVNRSVAHTVSLMSGGTTGNNREPSDDSTASTPASASSGPAPENPPTGTTDNSTPPSPDGTQPPIPRSNEAEIISPETTAHLNAAHIHGLGQTPTDFAAPDDDRAQAFNPNPAAFVPPSPLPAHPHWTWDVGNREFTNVVVTHVDADIVAIASDSGTAQIDIALLPLETRLELHYDSVLAAQAAAARRIHAAAVPTSRP